jgi:two-component system chemotaxis response regulator CheY
MRILVVDDDSVSRMKLSAILRGYGTCETADDGAEAIKLFEEAHKDLSAYDLITMDIEMPDMSGQDVVNKIRETEALLKLTNGQAAKILMVTAKTSLKEVSSSYYRGCNGYLTKPINPAAVAKALEELGIRAG